MAFNTSVDDAKGFVEPTIPPYTYLATIQEAKEKTNDNNGRNMLVVALKIDDTVPSGQDFDPDLFLDPYDAMHWDTIMESIDGDHPFFATNCKKKMAGFANATGTFDPTALDGMQVKFSVKINKKDGKAEVDSYSAV